MNPVVVQPNWLTYLPIISAVTAALIATGTAFLVLIITKKIDNTRQLRVFSVSLYTEIDFISTKLSELRKSNDGKSYVDARFLMPPDRLIWCYRGLAQNVGLLEAHTARQVVRFYSILNTMTTSAGAEVSYRFDKSDIDRVIQTANSALTALKNVDRRVAKVLADTSGRTKITNQSRDTKGE